jgi:diacylglycerol O-acyltransferase
LYSETATAHMHTLKVALLEEGFSFEVLVEELSHQLDALPPFRRRAVPVPLHLGHPVWVEDPQFDLRAHLERRQAAAPGGFHQLAEVVADIAGTPLPRDRPLWQMTLVEGLAEGRVAIVAKIHHAVADGSAAVALLQSVVSATNSPRPSTPSDWVPEALPTSRQLLVTSLRAHAPRLRGLPSLVRRTVRGSTASLRRRRSFAIRPALPLQTPRTSLNVSLGPRRTFAMVDLDLETLKVVRRARDVTLNDVFLTVCAGALRRYLDSRGELPDRPLVASVPVSTDPNAERMAGNRVDNLFVALATNIADPLERLARIHQETVAAKDVRSVLGKELFEQRAEILPPQLYTTSVRAWTSSRLANRLRPPVNVILSNVPGPAERLYFGQGELRAIYSVGPILEGIGVNITAWSYVALLHVSVLGCPESLPDPWALAEGLPIALDELATAAAAASR